MPFAKFVGGFWAAAVRMVCGAAGSCSHVQLRITCVPTCPQELRRAFEEERHANDDLTRDADRDRQNIVDLRGRWVLAVGAVCLQRLGCVASWARPPVTLRTPLY